jgi:hypothetical protein
MKEIRPVALLMEACSDTFLMTQNNPTRRSFIKYALFVLTNILNPRDDTRTDFAMKRLLVLSVFAIVSFPTFLPAQVAVDQRNVGERLICIVPMVGTGTYDDPKRPLYAPKPEELSKDGTGIISFNYEVSDDGKTALVELVARTPVAFKSIVEERRPDVQIFRKGLTTKEEIESAFKVHKKDFKAESFGDVRPEVKP